MRGRVCVVVQESIRFPVLYACLRDWHDDSSVYIYKYFQVFAKRVYHEIIASPTASNEPCPGK